MAEIVYGFTKKKEMAMVSFPNSKIAFIILLLFFSVCHSSILQSKYSSARQVRTVDGHTAAQKLYEELLSLNPNDATAATRVAAHPDAISRHSSIGNRGTLEERLSFTNQLKKFNFTSDAVAEHIFQTKSETAKSSAAPLYLKPLRAGSNVPPLPKCPLGACIQLLIMAACLPLDISQSLLGVDTVNLLINIGLVFLDDEWLVPYCHVMPVKLPNDQTIYLATDLHPNVLSTTTIGDGEGPVMYIGPDSLALLDNWNSQQRPSSGSRIVDIGSGSGIQALSMAALSAGGSPVSVTSIDINPRALRFTGLNFEWNGLLRPKLVWGDITDQNIPWEDILNNPTTILANPPFLPVPVQDPVISKRYGLFSSGGSSGEIILERIIVLASKALSEKSGTLAIVSEFMNPRSDFPLRLEHWWGTSTGRSGQALMFVNENPLDAETYAIRRADSEAEVDQWRKHLQQERITEISPGLLFIKAQSFSSKNSPSELKFSQYLVPKTAQGSIWTPTNLNARKYIKKIIESHWGTMAE